MPKISNIKFVILGLLLIISTFGYIKKTLEVTKNSERLIEIRTELEELESKKAHLESEIEFMQSEEFIEKSARVSLNLVKPNELVFIPEVNLKKDSNINLMQVGTTPSFDVKSNFQLWMEYFIY